MSLVNKPRLDGTRLIAVVLESVCYGILIVLLVLCLIVLRKRAKERGQTIFRPIFLVTCLLFTTITGHWISAVIELYWAFIPPRDVGYCVAPFGKTPAEAAFLTLKNPFNIAGSVYRLFIIWAKNFFIVIPPIVMSTGDLVCGIAVAYQFSRVDEPYFIAAKEWITALYAVSVGCNIYSTSLISLKLISPGANVHFQGIRKKVVEVLVQSAALYCLLAILILSFSLASTNLLFIATSLTNPVVGINFCLIVIRTNNQSSDVCVVETGSDQIQFTETEMAEA
ncbi:hypothetical protein CPB84DRAFT_1823357 [Gymnopilus junonius]|uniref:Uncharacterized protein n=1 Tax=Gymnopilus junonius TaxID=109634 RepID=A0A9P5NVI0_GYMJU|nr:hypothetical protein CPB84DRAFT_1823357 [Gymnopilus junonius]